MEIRGKKPAFQRKTKDSLQKGEYTFVVSQKLSRR